MARMHVEIQNLTPILEKINQGGSLDAEDTKVLNGVSEKMIRDIFEWIQNEKKIRPESSFVNAEGLYTRFITAYNLAKEKNETLRATNTEAIRSQLAKLSNQVQPIQPNTITPPPVPQSVVGGTHITVEEEPKNGVESITKPYPDKQTAFANTLRERKSFPFTVQYTEGGKSYDAVVSVDKNTIVISGKKIEITHPNTAIESIRMDKDAVYVKGTMGIFTGEKSMSKDEFIKTILPTLLTLNASKDVTLFEQTFTATVKGVENPKPIDTPTQQVNAIEKRFLQYKSDMVKEISKPYTVDGLSKALSTLSEEKDSDKKRILASIIWSKLAGNEYTMTIQNGRISLQHSNDQKNAELLEATLEAHISSQKISITDFQQAILLGSGGFGSYLDTQGVNISNISTEKYANFLTEYLGIDLTKGTVTDKIARINQSKASSTEKAFLISYVNGGFTGYNLAPDAKRELELKSMNAELATSKEYSVAKDIVGKVSGGEMEKEAGRIKAGGKKEEFTIESFMANPTRAVTHYPWTSLALIAGSIWKFGFGKTIFGLLASVIGLKAINEIGGETELGKKLKEGVKDGLNTMVGKGKEVASTVTAATTNATTEAPKETLSPFQKALREKTMSNTQLITDIDKLAIQKESKYPGKIDDYLRFIETDMKDIPLSKLFPSNHKESIFFDNFSTPISVDSKLSGKMLKRVLREYLTGNSTLTGNGDKLGEKEQTDFLSLHKITPADIQNKKLSDILESVHKVRTSETTQTPQPEAPRATAANRETPAPVTTNKRYNIAGTDVDVGKNVQTSDMILTYDDAGKIYKNIQSKLPKDKSGKLYIPQDGVVKLGAKTIKVGQVDCVEVKYMGETVYVPLAFLK